MRERERERERGQAPGKNTTMETCLVAHLDTHSDRGATRTASRACVRLWRIPPRSPDLNPSERMWAWLRKKLRTMDLADVSAGRPPVGKPALKARVRALMRTAAAKAAAGKYARGLRKVCADVVRRRGAAVPWAPLHHNRTKSGTNRNGH